MTNYLNNSYPIINIYKKPSIKSEIVTQMIYGDSFSIYKKSKKSLKIKIKEDNYKGYIQNKNFHNFLKPTHKISILKSILLSHIPDIYIKINNVEPISIIIINYFQ